VEENNQNPTAQPPQDSSSEEITPSTPPIVKAKPSLKPSMFIAGLLILLLIILSGAFLFIAKMTPQSQQPKNIAKNPTPTLKFTNGNQTIDTSNWKLATNEAAHYSIKYPPNFQRFMPESSFKYYDQYRNGSVVEVGFVGQGVDIKVVDKIDKAIFYSYPNSTKTIKIDGIEAPVSFNPIEGIKVGPFEKDNLIYEVQYFDTDKTLTEIPQEFNQILSTFKFTN